MIVTELYASGALAHQGRNDLLPYIFVFSLITLIMVLVNRFVTNKLLKRIATASAVVILILAVLGFVGTVLGQCWVFC
jgi:hypothetical protein